MEPFRKARLAKLLARADLHIQLDEHIEEDGATVFEHACKLGLEGIVSSGKGRVTAQDARRIGSRARTRPRQL
jgi:ATP-dependent DNA ligase